MGGWPDDGYVGEYSKEEEEEEEEEEQQQQQQRQQLLYLDQKPLKNSCNRSIQQ